LLWGTAWTTPEADPGVGNTTEGVSIKGNHQVSISAGTSVGLRVNRSGDGQVAAFYRNGTGVGNISVSAGATAYNTSSDERLKENITPADDPSAIIDALEVVQYDWRAGGHVRWGIVAQDANAVFPEAITPGDNGQQVAVPWSVDPSKLVFMLVKEIQLLRARVAALEAA
jgi:hypothetical protein